MRFRTSFHLARIQYDAVTTMQQSSEFYMPRAAYGDEVYFGPFCAFWPEVSFSTRLIKAPSRMSKFSEFRNHLTNQTFRHQTPVLSAPVVLCQSALLSFSSLQSFLLCITHCKLPFLPTQAPDLHLCFLRLTPQ